MQLAKALIKTLWPVTIFNLLKVTELILGQLAKALIKTLWPVTVSRLLKSTDDTPVL